MPKGIPRNKSTQRKILHRLKIVRGSLDKVISMVEKNEYCINIVHQSQALQAALKKNDQLILQNHLSTCVVHNIKEGQNDKMIEEVMKVISKI